MASTTFTYTPDFGAQLTEKPRVLTARFGDGYSQDVGDGINVRLKSWAVTFNTRTDAEMAPILAFLRARNGIEGFNWTDPDGYTGVFICREWQRGLVKFGINSLSATFEEAPGK